jgi:Flp pilus assembly protein CpaB
MTKSRKTVLIVVGVAVLYYLIAGVLFAELGHRDHGHVANQSSGTHPGSPTRED